MFAKRSRFLFVSESCRYFNQLLGSVPRIRRPLGYAVTYPNEKSLAFNEGRHGNSFAVDRRRKLTVGIPTRLRNADQLVSGRGIARVDSADQIMLRLERRGGQHADQIVGVDAVRAACDDFAASVALNRLQADRAAAKFCEQPAAFGSI